METMKKQIAKIMPEVRIFVPARMVFEGPEAPAKDEGAKVETAEAQAVAPKEGEEKKDPKKHEADKAATRVESSEQIAELKAEVGDKKPEAGAEKPEASAEKPGDKPAEAAKPTEAAKPAAPANAPAQAGAAEKPPVMSAEEQVKYEKFKNSFVGTLAGMFAEGDTPEEKEKSIKETYVGKGLLGALAAVLGLGATSAMIDKFANKSPKTKGILGRIRDLFSGLTDDAPESEKLTALGFVEACKNPGSFNKDYELTEEVKVPDRTTILFSQASNENELGSITIPDDAKDIVVLVSKGGIDEERVLKAGSTYDTKKVGVDFKIPSGTSLPQGVKLSRYCQFVVDKAPEKAAA